MLNQPNAVEALYAAAYLEDYLDGVENLPDDIQRNISQLRELDIKYQEILQELDHHQNTLNGELESSSRRRTMLQIQRALIRSQDLGDEKLQILQQMQDLIENKARQLDQDQKNLDLGRENENHSENSKHDPQPERTSKRSRRQRNNDASNRDDSMHDRHEKETSGNTSGGGSGKKQKKKKRRAKMEKEREPSPIDPPIDPDEPTYCLCEQVSYGEMIGCDNDSCPIEWFHFSCVGLTTKPKGKWYCPKCRGDRSNQMKPKGT